MKTELQYLKDALDIWCKRNKWSRQMPITAEACLEVLTVADKLRADDKAKLDSESAS